MRPVDVRLYSLIIPPFSETAESFWGFCQGETRWFNFDVTTLTGGILPDITAITTQERNRNYEKLFSYVNGKLRIPNTIYSRTTITLDILSLNLKVVCPNDFRSRYWTTINSYEYLFGILICHVLPFPVRAYCLFDYLPNKSRLKVRRVTFLAAAERSGWWDTAIIAPFERGGSELLSPWITRI